MNWLSPSAAWWLLLVPALIALYMLRPRPRRRVVSSLRLWEKLPQVDRPKARIRRPPLSLLLLLQALLLLAGAVALIQPAISAPAPRHLVILLDASGSMQAADGSSSRFERAKEEARDLASEMRAEDRATLLRVGPNVAAVCSRCTRGELERTLSDARPGVGRADMTAALKVASGLAGRPEAETSEGRTYTYLISDGAFDEVVADEMPQPLRFIQIGSEADNRGIAVLSARRPPDGSPGYSVYARLVNQGASQVSLDVLSYADTVPLPERKVELPAQGHADLVWQLPPGAARFSVSIGPRDALAADDQAAITLPGEEQYRVRINAANPDLYRRVLLGIPGIEPTTQEGGQVAFTIVEGQIPDPLPPGNLLLVNPTGGLLPSEGELTNVRPQLAAQDHPLLFGVDIGALLVEKGKQLEAVPWLEPVAQSDQGPLILAGEHEGRRIAVLAFDPRDSNLPKLVAFPLLMSNLVDWLYPLASTQAVRPGERLYLAPGASVTTPNGRRVRVGDAGLFTGTEEQGVYEVTGSTEEPIAFAVNMTDEAESDLTTRPHTELESASEGAEERFVLKEYWSPLASLALVLVGTEWLLYCWRRGRQ